LFFLLTAAIIRRNSGDADDDCRQRPAVPTETDMRRWRQAEDPSSPFLYFLLRYSHRLEEKLAEEIQQGRHRSMEDDDDGRSMVLLRVSTLGLLYAGYTANRRPKKSKEKRLRHRHHRDDVGDFSSPLSGRRLWWFATNHSLLLRRAHFLVTSAPPSLETLRDGQLFVVTTPGHVYTNTG